MATVQAQTDSPFVLRKRIPVQAVDVAVDNLNNIYLLTTNDQLKKFYPSGDSAAVYNDVLTTTTCGCTMRWSSN